MYREQIFRYRNIYDGFIREHPDVDFFRPHRLLIDNLNHTCAVFIRKASVFAFDNFPSYADFSNGSIHIRLHGDVLTVERGYLCSFARKIRASCTRHRRSFDLAVCLARSDDAFRAFISLDICRIVVIKHSNIEIWRESLFIVIAQLNRFY